MTSDALPDTDQRTTLLDEWVEARRQVSVWEAKSAGLLARRTALMESDTREAPLHRDAIWRSMIAEYSAAGHISKGSVEFAFTDAHSLSEDFPALLESFEAGRITAAHVREIIRAALVVTQAIDDGTVDAGILALYEASALEFAENDSPAGTRAHVREIAAALAGQTLTQRHKTAEQERNVSVKSVGDGLALLQAVLPEHLALAIMDRLSQMAHHIRRHPEDRDPTLPPLEPDDAQATRSGGENIIFGDGCTFTLDPFGPDGPPMEYDWIPASDNTDDSAAFAAFEAQCDAIDDALASDSLFDPNSLTIIHISADHRTTDQIRADILADLLLGADPSEVNGTGLDNITAHVQVTVAATTLADLDDRPAQLDNEGALHPDVARALAGRNTGWTRLFLDPTGLVTETDTYTPTAGMRRYLKARDQHCRFPGCRMPVHRCDLDHTHDHAQGGPTSIDNLAHLCRGHHVLKHPDIPDAHRWTARQRPDWTLEWTSPNGRVHTDRPPRRVMFVPSEAPPSADSPRSPWSPAEPWSLASPSATGPEPHGSAEEITPAVLAPF